MKNPGRIIHDADEFQISIGVSPTAEIITEILHTKDWYVSEYVLFPGTGYIYCGQHKM